MKSTLRPYPLDRLVRSRMTRLVVALMAWTVAVGAVPVGKPEDVGLSSERLQRINQVVQRYIDAKQISGRSDGRTRAAARTAHFEAQGLMDVEAKTPMRKDGIFRMASMTKPVIGVADPDAARGGEGPPDRSGVAVHSRIQGLEGGDSECIARRCDERGSHGRGQPPRAPEIYTVPATRDITVRDLLTHTSGLESGGAGTREAARIAPRQSHERWRPTCRSSARCRSTSSLARMALQRSRRHRNARPHRRGRVRPDASTCSSSSASSIRSGMKDTAFFPTDGEPAARGDALRPDAGGLQASGDARLAGDEDASSPAAAGCGPPPTTTCSLRRCSSTAAS